MVKTTLKTKVKQPCSRCHMTLICCLLGFLILCFIVYDPERSRNTCEIDVIEFVDNTVPKLVHLQHWPSSDPATERTFEKWQQMRKAVLQNHTFVVWNMTTMRELIERKYSWFLPTYDGYPSNMHRGDAARYFILHAYGGIYMDLDYLPLIDIHEYLHPEKPSVLESPLLDTNSYGTAMMSSPVMHTAWEKVFKSLETNKAQQNPVYATGPSMLRSTLDPSKDVYVLPCKFLSLSSIKLLKKRATND
jgi:mannosyltransferase OCH1-like enzyme